MEKFSDLKTLNKRIFELSLNDFKEVIEQYFKNRKVKLNIHISTELDKVKANIQGNITEFDIIVSGEIKFEKLFEAIAHEVAHIVLMDENHSNKWQIEKDKVFKFLIKKLKERLDNKQKNK